MARKKIVVHDGQLAASTPAPIRQSATEARAMTLEEEHAMLAATAKVIRHELAGLPTDPALERPTEMVRVAGEIFLAFVDGRVDRLAHQLKERAHAAN